MAQSRGLISGVAVSTGAGIGGVASGSTGGSRHHSRVAVASGSDAFRIAAGASGAGVGPHTGGGAGGSLGHRGGVAVIAAAVGIGGPVAGGRIVKIHTGVIARYAQVSSLVPGSVVEDHGGCSQSQGIGPNVLPHQSHFRTRPGIGIQHAGARRLVPGVDIDRFPTGSGVVIVHRDGAGSGLAQTAAGANAAGIAVRHSAAAVGTQTADVMTAVSADVATDRTAAAGPAMPAAHTADGAIAGGGIGVADGAATEAARPGGAVTAVTANQTANVAGAAVPGVVTLTAADGAHTVDPAMGHAETTAGTHAGGIMACMITAGLIGHPAFAGGTVHSSAGSVARSGQIAGLVAGTVVEDDVGGLDRKLDGVDAVAHMGHGRTGPSIGELGSAARCLRPGVGIDVAPIGSGVVIVDREGSGCGLRQATHRTRPGSIAVIHADTAGGTQTAGGVAAVRAVHQSHVLVVHALLMDQVAQHQNGGGDPLHGDGAIAAAHIQAPQRRNARLGPMDTSLPVTGGQTIVAQVHIHVARACVEDDHDAVRAFVVGIAADVEHDRLIGDLVVAGVVPGIAAAGTAQSRVVLTEVDQTAHIIIGHLSVFLALQIGPTDLVDVVVGTVGIVVAVAGLVLLLTQQLLAGVDEGRTLGHHDHSHGQIVHPHHLGPVGSVTADDDLVHQTVVVVAGHIVDRLRGRGGPAVGSAEVVGDRVSIVPAAGGEAPGVAVIAGDGVTEAVVEEAEAAHLPGIALGSQIVAILHSRIAGSPALAVEQDMGILGLYGADDLIDGDSIDQAGQVEAEAVDVVFLHPEVDGVHDHVPHHDPLSSQVVAAAGAVGPVALAVETGVVVGDDLVAAVVAAVEGVVVHHVHDHVHPVRVEGLDHGLELGDTGTAIEGIGGISALHTVIVLGIVTPGILLPNVQIVLIHGGEVVHRHQLHMGHAQLLQVVQTGGIAIVVGAGLGHAQIGPLPVAVDSGGRVDGHFPDVHLINDGIGVIHVLVGAHVLIPTLGVRRIEVHDHAPIAVGTHALGIGICSLHGIAGEHHIVIIIVSAQITGQGHRPNTGTGLGHLGVLHQVAGAIVAGIIDLHIDLLGRGGPHLEGGGGFAPGRAQIIAMISVLGSELIGVEDVVGVVADGAIEAAMLDLEAASLRQAQLPAQAQGVTIALHGDAGDAHIRGIPAVVQDREIGDRPTGQGQTGLDPNRARLIIIVGIAQLSGGDHILPQHPQTGSRSGVQIVVDRAAANIGQIDEPVIEFLIGPVGLTDRVAQIQIGGTVQGVGSQHALILSVGSEGNGAGRLVAPEPHVPISVIAALPVEVQDHGDLPGIGDGVISRDDHSAVAVIAASTNVAGISHPFPIHHELVLMDTGAEGLGERPNAVSVGHQIGGLAPAVEGTSHGNRCGSAFIAEGDRGAVHLRRDVGSRLSGGHDAIILAVRIGSGTGLDPDLLAGRQDLIADGDVSGLTAVPVMEDQAQAVAGGRGIVQGHGVVAISAPGQDLTGPVIAGQGSFRTDLPSVAHHAAPTKGIDEVDGDALLGGIAADGADIAGHGVPGGSDGLGIAVAAGGAGVSLHTGGGTASGGSHLAGVAVPGGGDGLGVAVTADGAGVGPDARRSTGSRRGDGPGVAVRAAGNGVAQHQRLVGIHRQAQYHLRTAGDPHLVDLDPRGSGVVERGGGSIIAGITVGHIPALVVSGLHRHIAVAFKGHGQLAIHELVDADGLIVLFAAIVGPVDIAEQIISPGRAAGGTGSAGIAVAQRRDGLDIAVAADGAAISPGSLLGTGRRLGDGAGVAVGAAGNGVAQHQCLIGVHRQAQHHLCPAGDPHLVDLDPGGSGVVERSRGGIIAGITVGHIPALVVSGLHRHIAVAFKGHGQLAIHELVDADGLIVLLTAIVGTIDIAKQIVGPGDPTGAASRAGVAVARGRGLIAGIAVAAAGAGIGGVSGGGARSRSHLGGIAVPRGSDDLGVAGRALGAGVGPHAGGGTGGRRSDRTGVAVAALRRSRHIAQSQTAVTVLHQSEGDLHAAGDQHLLSGPGAGVIEGSGGIGDIGLGHVPVGIVPGLHCHIAVGSEGGSQLAIDELIFAQIGVVFLAAIVGTVDVAEEIVVHIAALHHSGRGRFQRRRDLLAEQQPSVLRIIHEHVADTGDRLDRIVVAHLPGIHRILFDPLQQDIQALDDTIGAPHIPGIAPPGIQIQHRTGAITTDGKAGIIIPIALAIGGVVAGAVLAGVGGTQMHQVTNVGGLIADALTMGPDMLLIVADAPIPGAAHQLAPIDGGDIGGIALQAVGVEIIVAAIQIVAGVAVGSEGGMLRHHHILQRGI